MATVTATLKFSLILFSFLHAQSITAATVAEIKFVRRLCKAVAPFKPLCVGSLKSKAASIDRDEKKLAKIALELALNRTLSAQLFIIRFGRDNALKKADHDALRSCTEMVGSSVSQLHRSLMELENLEKMARGTEQFTMTVNNMHEGSAVALAGTQSCKDLMSDQQSLHSGLRVTLKARMDYSSQVIANSMALTNTFVTGGHI